MKFRRQFCIVALFLGLASVATAAGVPLNTLTSAEQKAGWKLLFDGRSLAGWRSLKQSGPRTAGS